MNALPKMAAIALIAICVPAMNAKASVEDADEAKVANCTFVKDVSGKTQSSKYTRSALGAAMEQARDDAAKAGATHIVWNKIKSANVTNVTGKAYRCPG